MSEDTNGIEDDPIKLTIIDGFTWFPVRCKPRCEKRLKAWCRHHDINCYLPIIRKRKRYQRRTVESTVPMFPGYLFAQLSNNDHSCLTRSGKVLLIIRISQLQEDSLLKDLYNIRLLEQAAVEHTLRVKPELVVGKKVLVNQGPFKGFSGVIKQRRTETTIAVNVDWLGQSVSTIIDVGELGLE